jgi:hypothetical protein
MDTKDKVKEIYEYMTQQLAEGVYISKKREREMIKEIKFMLTTD